MLLEERSVLATHDARVKKTRTTKAAFQALVDSEIPPDVPDDVAKLAAELMAERQAVRDAREVQDCQKPLKALLMTLNRMWSPLSLMAARHVLVSSLQAWSTEVVELRKWRSHRRLPTGYETTSTHRVCAMCSTAMSGLTDLHS